MSRPLRVTTACPEALWREYFGTLTVRRGIGRLLSEPKPYIRRWQGFRAALPDDVQVP